jgi:hypothetical protein
MPLNEKNSVRELRQLNVSAEMAGTFLGLIFGGVALSASLLAMYTGNQPDVAASHFCEDLALVLFAIAGISIYSRIRKLDSKEKRLRLLLGLILGFVVFALDISSMVYFELKLQGFPGWVEWIVFSVHAIVGFGCLGLFTMARAFAK